MDAFLKIEGDTPIAGESTDSLHANEIEILTYGHSLGTVPSDEERGIMLEMLPLVIVKPLDKTTPSLAQAACRRTNYSTITLSVCQRPASVATDDKIDLFTIKLEDAYISRVTLLGTAMPWPMMPQSAQYRFSMPMWTYPEIASYGPLEQIEVMARKWTWTYKGNAGNGNTQGVYDIRQFAAVN